MAFPVATAADQFHSEGTNRYRSFTDGAGGFYWSVVPSDITTADTLTELAAVDPGQYRQTILSDGLRTGSFRWNSSDLSASVTNDPSQGAFVAPDWDVTGASGVWERSGWELGTIEAAWFQPDNTGVADAQPQIQAAIEFAFDFFTPVTGAFNRAGTDTTGPRVRRGGSTVRVPPGSYRTDAAIGMFPSLTLELDNAHIIMNHAGSGIQRDREGIDPVNKNSTTAFFPGLFTYDKMQIVGRGSAAIHGEATGSYGVLWYDSDLCSIDNIRIENCLIDGFYARYVQHSKIENCDIHSNGGWGIRLSETPSAGVRGSDSNTISSCLIMENGAGGVLIDAGVGNCVVGGSLKFHGDGPGFQVQPLTASHSVNVNSCTGSTSFESNKWHWRVLAQGSQVPRLILIQNAYYVISPGGAGSGLNEYPVWRFGVNEGLFTVVEGGTTFNNPLDWPNATLWPAPDHPAGTWGTVLEDPYDATAEGSQVTNSTTVYSRAMFEQSATLGGITIRDMVKARGGVSTARLPFVCDFDGNLYDENLIHNTVLLEGHNRGHPGSNVFNTAAYFGFDGAPDLFSTLATRSGDYVGVLSDAGLTILMDDAAANEFTIPGSGFVDYPIGTTIWVYQASTGLTSIDPGGGVTFNGGTATVALVGGQGAGVRLVKISQDNWLGLGNV